MDKKYREELSINLIIFSWCYIKKKNEMKKNIF